MQTDKEVAHQVVTYYKNTNGLAFQPKVEDEVTYEQLRYLTKRHYLQVKRIPGEGWGYKPTEKLWKYFFNLEG